uniref:Uncharacterized protein n=1 Tax=Cryptococcus bacillisporus CA1280 TaxID=1296109 RepID=A0A0D0TH48_CRYGA|nr:hypothetical protein I312_05119 [Cryptococcus bacillisporus CA1280]
MNQMNKLPRAAGLPSNSYKNGLKQVTHQRTTLHFLSWIRRWIGPSLQPHFRSLKNLSRTMCLTSNKHYAVVVVDEPEFTFRGGLIPPGRIRPMDLEEYQSQISILAEDQQAWKAAHSVPFHQLCLSHQAYKIQVACMSNPMARGMPATQFIRSLATQLAILTNFLKKWPKVLTLRMKRLRSNTFRPIGTRACLGWQTVVLASTVMLKISRTSTNGLQRHCNLVIEKPRAKSAKHLRAPV